MKILLDTDLGNDIDDAITLSYLLKQPDCELLGITTVTPGAVDRAKLASAVCADLGRTVPIRPGAELPLAGEPLQEPPFSAAELLSRWPHETAFPSGAVPFLAEAILAHPGEVTLIAIGPLTNVGRLLRDHPETASQLKSLVLMGGRFFTGGETAEWNIRNDPAAAAIVFAAPIPHLRAVGLDVTRSVFLTEQDFRHRFGGLLLDFSGPWFARRDRVTFHDPLAAATLFEPLCGYQKGSITVEEDGTTKFTADPAGTHEVAQSVAVQAFFDHYFEIA
ncbi:nucleoside hydrolase [Rhizocola hellebori]|uniref:nucleoside hydrolase n=1 Tax=Rhizocola hellebori TaxID=1392758 RepID=UPI0019408AB5|nr:nucleoside hydrolase [Rhizocola hellebori]